MQAQGDPRENYPDCGKRTNSQRATGGKADDKREIAMPATSAIWPPGIPGTIQKEGEKTVEKIVDKLPLSIR